MQKINRFEDIQSWKSARTLTNEIYKVTAEGDFFRDFGLKDQIRRASVSILSNIAEGFERGNDKEFAYFLSLAKGSSGKSGPNYMWLLIWDTFRRNHSTDCPSV